MLLTYARRMLPHAARKELQRLSQIEICIPADLEVYCEGRSVDTLTDGHIGAIKQIIYYDSTGCSSCQINHLAMTESLFTQDSTGCRGCDCYMANYRPDPFDLLNANIEALAQDESLDPGESSTSKWLTMRQILFRRIYGMGMFL